MDEKYRKLLGVPQSRLEAINQVILDPKSEVMKAFLAVVDKYGAPEEINRKHRASRELPNLLRKIEATQPAHLKDIQWLQQQVQSDRFVSIRDYRRRSWPGADSRKFADDFAVTLEVSALQYFEWVREMAERALEQKSLVPGRFIAVRKMKESEADGDCRHRRRAGHYGRNIRRDPRYQGH